MRKRPGDSASENSKIFISYRREDSAGHAGHLCKVLERHFGTRQIFMDVSGIGAGKDFVRVIERELASSKVLIAVIGQRWLKAVGEIGQPQGGAGDDWVRFEIAAALDKELLIIPVLVDGAPMPEKADLPPGLKRLAGRNAKKISNEEWDRDVDSLIKELDQVVPRKNVSQFILPVALALIEVLFALYYFFTVPLPQKFQGSRPVLMGKDELIITGPVVNKAGVLLSREVGPSEHLNVELDSAQPGEQTIEAFELDAGSSSIFQRMTYSSYEDEDADPQGNHCVTSVEVKNSEGGRPEALHFSQRMGNAGECYLEVKSVGAELLVNLSTTPSENKLDVNDTGPGCGKLLTLTTPYQRFPRYGRYAAECLVVAGSASRFTFITPTEEPAGEKGEAICEPFQLGSPPQPDDPSPFLEARAVSIKSLTGGSSAFDIQSVDEKKLLRIDSLKLESKGILVGVSGEGVVTENGENGVGLRERIERHPVKAGLLGMLTLTFLVWLALLIRPFFRI